MKRVIERSPLRRLPLVLGCVSAVDAAAASSGADRAKDGCRKQPPLKIEAVDAAAASSGAGVRFGGRRCGGSLSC
jgi:hypothetical protein